MMNFSLKNFSLVKLLLRIGQQEGTPESVGRGAALGLTVGFLFPVGFQTPPVILLAFLFRANKLVSWLATCITNPATMLFIYPAQCYLGSLLMFRPLSLEKFRRIFLNFMHTFQEGAWREILNGFLNLGVEVLVPFFIGGLVLSLVTAPLGYWLGVRVVRLYRKRREERQQRKLRRQNRRAEENGKS